MGIVKPSAPAGGHDDGPGGYDDRLSAHQIQADGARRAIPVGQKLVGRRLFQGADAASHNGGAERVPDPDPRGRWASDRPGYAVSSRQVGDLRADLPSPSRRYRLPEISK